MRLNAEHVAVWSCLECGEALDPQAPEPLTIHKCEHCGKKQMVPGMFAQFRLVDLLAKGASGYVFKANDEQLRRDVAIKILRAENDEGQKRADHCIEKARVLAAISHHNIVHIFNINENDGLDFIVMELVTGGKALNLINQSTPPDEKRVLDFALGVAEGLRAAHKVDLVHMNVKPNNILLSDDGTPKLLDFGSAQFGKSKGIIGTPYYIAPEVAQHQPPDFKSDMYSFGASLFHIFTGKPPFTGKSAQEVIRKRLKYLAPPISKYRDDVSEASDQLVARMLQPHPDNRYASYEEVIEAIHSALDGETNRLDHDDEEPSSALNLLAEASADVDLNASTGRTRRRSRLSDTASKGEFEGFDELGSFGEDQAGDDDPASALDALAGIVDEASHDEPIDLDEQIPLSDEHVLPKPQPKKRPKSPTDPTMIGTGNISKNRKSRPKNPEGSASETLGKTDLGAKNSDQVDAISEPDL